MVREKDPLILPGAEEISTFAQATEEDLNGIYELCISWNSRTAPFEARLKSYLKNPSIYYVLKKEEKIVGFLGMIPFTKASLKKIMNETQDTFYGTYSELLGDENTIVAFKKREKVESLFIDIAVRQDLPKHRQYAMRLIQGCIEVLEALAKQGIVVRKLHASSSVPAAIRICRNMRCTELPKIGESSRLRFELDLESSDLAMLKEYQHVTKMLETQ